MTAIAAAVALSLPISLCDSCKVSKKFQGVKGGFGVFAVLGEANSLGPSDKKSLWGTLFDVEDPRSKAPQCKGRFLDVYQALELARYDIQYCDWRARQDLRTIVLLHEKVVEVLNPLAREYKSIGTMKKELAELQGELAQAHKQVHISEARVSAALDKLAYMEELVNGKLLEDRTKMESSIAAPSSSTSTQSLDTMKRPRKSLDVSGPVQPYHPRLKNFWYPVAFSTDLKDETMIPIDCFEEPWVLFRGKDGNPGCIQNTCAHRACPLHLGSVNEGRIQCPYHGYLVKFLTPASGLQGYWDPYPIDMEFQPPCMVLSTIGISKPGKLEGQSTKECATHLHQLHVCLPSSRNKTRLLYRMSLDFAPLLKHIPFMHYLWRHFAEQVLNEDLRLVIGQQERMINGANVWNWPVAYDKLGVRYRLWRDAVERGSKPLPFSKPI
ncbi:hypothetical protein GOBAR_DD32346 [Gossypium barbadense]|nr:hypothetical protein GOBAR_DD32346 [Gossypium barbadense]